MRPARRGFSDPICSMAEITPGKARQVAFLCCPPVGGQERHYQRLARLTAALWDGPVRTAPYKHIAQPCDRTAEMNARVRGSVGVPSTCSGLPVSTTSP